MNELGELRRIWRAASRLALLAACWSWLAADCAKAAQSVWELTPYRIRVLMAVAPKPELTARLVEQVQAVIAERADLSIGAPWDLQIELAPAALQRAMLASLAELSFENLPPELLDGDDDKAILLSIGYRNGNYLVGARDFDLRSRLSAAAVNRSVADRPTLGDEAFRAILEAFAPLAEIEVVADKQATLRLRAAALPVADPTLMPVRAGDAFRGVIRFNDRDGKLRKLMPLDWTFMTVQSVNCSELTCNLHSGLRSPLSARRRGRSEQLALLTRPPGGSTRLQLRSRASGGKAGSSRPLPGYEIFAHPADSPATVRLGRTDGRGELVVPADASAVRVLLVKHGADTLARLPVMPGLSPEAQAEIPDDDARLAAEGEVAGLQENLVELVANRAVFMHLIRLRMKDGKLDEAKQLMQELRKLGRQDDLSQLIDRRMRAAISADPRMQKKIDRMFEDTREIINRFLNQAEVDKLETDLERALRGEMPAAEEKE
ncbi:MAG TPA: hypothetical protein VMV10_02515 [Pirellulales bacterium]|nr:hypothetical protein [Pirellulales bacterium]